MILFFDNFDSFSNNIVKKIYKQNFLTNIINLTIKNFFYFKEKIFFFGPGPKSPKNSNLISLILDKYLGKKYFYGICLGYQIINCYFGSKILKITKLLHGQLKSIYLYIKNKKIFINKKFMKYNSLYCTKNYYNISKSCFKLENYSNINYKFKIKINQFHLESFFSYKNFIL